MTIRELLIQFGFEADDRQLRGAEGALNSIRSRFVVTAGDVVNFAKQAFTAISSVVTGAVEQGDSALEAAQRVGVHVEALQRLRFAASTAGVANEALETSLKFLGKQLDEARRGSKESRDAMERAGIGAEQFGDSTFTADRALLKIADTFRSMPEGPRRTALAMELMSRGGGQMIPLLIQGSAQMQHLGDEAQRAGAIIDEKTARAADALSDKMRLMGARVDGLKLRIGTGLMPILERAVDGFSGWLEANGAIIAQNMADVIRGIGEVMRVVVGIAGDLRFGLSIAFDDAKTAVDLLKIALATIVALNLQAMFLGIGAAVHALAVGMTKTHPLIAVLSLAATLAVLVRDNWDELADAGRMVANAFREAWGSLFDWFEGKLRSLRDWFNDLRSIGREVRDVLSGDVRLSALASPPSVSRAVTLQTSLTANFGAPGSAAVREDIEVSLFRTAQRLQEEALRRAAAQGAAR